MTKYLRQPGRRDSRSRGGGIFAAVQTVTTGTLSKLPKRIPSNNIRSNYCSSYAAHTHTQNNTAVSLGNPKTRPTYSKFNEPKGSPVSQRRTDSSHVNNYSTSATLRLALRAPRKWRPVVLSRLGTATFRMEAGKKSRVDCCRCDLQMATR